MLRSLLLNYPWDGQNCLFSYIQRTGALTIGQAGALTDDLLGSLQSESFDVVFLHLSTTDEMLSEPFLDTLRQHPRLVITSPFPRQLYTRFNLKPAAYLTEPYTFDRFQKCLNQLPASPVVL